MANQSSLGSLSLPLKGEFLIMLPQNLVYPLIVALFLYPDCLLSPLEGKVLFLFFW